MQHQPPRPPADRYVAPTAPHVPIHAVQSLIPRLATTINDIDGLKAQLAAGNADRSMPSWDTLLQRYAILLGRVQSLTSYISQPPVQRGTGAGAVAPGAVRPPPPPGPGVTGSTTPAETASALAHYLVHPLHPLPSDASPMANDTLLQAINTQLLPSVSGAQEQLLAPAEGDGEGPHPADFLPLDELNRLDEPALTGRTNKLKNRLARESHRAQAMKREIDTQFEQYDWAMRLDDAADEGDKGDEDDDDDDDLFGGDEDDDGDATMATAKAEAPAPIPNPRAGWTITDYLRLLDTGRGPTPAAPSTAAGAAGAAPATSQPAAAPAPAAA
ncbi:uncharacterized protein LOC62_04G005569 [Vanrija pseudolonga]|uniref:Uncharacterized protein n=1 Tax=Vanrija pseudolonga TaxID=143232 RepID=A0AAF0Y9W1_9TREE|nr:hypothetical protein LOC62_04G005569 [Vanrija pseudolonga]